MKKKMNKMKISWLNDLISLGKDTMYFVRDIINNATHLVVRFLKLVTAVSVWQKDLSRNIELKLKRFRTNLKMKK